MIIFGHKKAADTFFERDIEYDLVFPKAGDWIRCPACGNEYDTILIYWEKTDFDFHCLNCNNSEGIR